MSKRNIKLEHQRTKSEAIKRLQNSIDKFGDPGLLRAQKLERLFDYVEDEN